MVLCYSWTMARIHTYKWPEMGCKDLDRYMYNVHYTKVTALFLPEFMLGASIFFCSYFHRLCSRVSSEVCYFLDCFQTPEKQVIKISGTKWILPPLVRKVERLKDVREGGIMATHPLNWSLKVQKTLLLFFAQRYWRKILQIMRGCIKNFDENYFFQGSWFKVNL